MRHIAIGLVIALAPALAHGAEDDASFFLNKVQPILQDSCYKCHGPDKQKAHLRLDSRDGVLQGGKHGAAAVPGDPDHSLLIKAVRYGDQDLQMPPKEQLSDEKIKVLVDWIQRGVPWEVVVPVEQRAPPPPAH
jgi:hypothetical protein